ncbi:helix-turn-helix domain-containing protein [Streptomyces sp. NPDC005483]|uniref:helix-turn-helix domain-containing protein n=1 Tax=Streptomyces sp. NPDC005483 TaxID=3154882 RepID=UPI0033A14CCE
MGYSRNWYLSCTIHPLNPTRCEQEQSIVLSVNSADFLTTDEAAELLGVERRSVYTYVQRLAGFPQPERIGRTLLFERKALLEWRAKHPRRRRPGPTQN